MFEIFKNKKFIPKSIGEIVTSQYTIEYIVPIANAVELHKSFVASEKQHTAVKRLSVDERLNYQVVDQAQDLDFGKNSTYIKADSCTKFFLSTVDSTQYFSGSHERDIGSERSRFFEALQNPGGANAAAFYFLQSISADIEWLEFDSCTKPFIDLSLNLAIRLPMEHWKFMCLYMVQKLQG